MNREAYIVGFNFDEKVKFKTVIWDKRLFSNFRIRILSYGYLNESLRKCMKDSECRHVSEQQVQGYVSCTIEHAYRKAVDVVESNPVAYTLDWESNTEPLVFGLL